MTLQAARMVLDESHAAANISSSPAKAKHAAKRALQIGQQGTRCGACLNCKQLRQVPQLSTVSVLDLM